MSHIWWELWSWVQSVTWKHGNCDSSASHNTPFDYFYSGDQNSSGVRPGQTGLEGGGRNSTLDTPHSTPHQEGGRGGDNPPRRGWCWLTGTISSGWFSPAQPTARPGLTETRGAESTGLSGRQNTVSGHQPAVVLSSPQSGHSDLLFSTT